MKTWLIMLATLLLAQPQVLKSGDAPTSGSIGGSLKPKPAPMETRVDDRSITLTHLTNLGHKQGVGTLISPRDLYLDEYGFLYACDKLLNRVNVWDDQLNSYDEFGLEMRDNPHFGLVSFMHVAADPGGDAHVLTSNNLLLSFGPSGMVERRLDLNIGRNLLGFTPAQFSDDNLAINSKGDFLIKTIAKEDGEFRVIRVRPVEDAAPELSSFPDRRFFDNTRGRRKPKGPFFIELDVMANRYEATSETNRLYVAHGGDMLHEFSTQGGAIGSLILKIPARLEEKVAAHLKRDGGKLRLSQLSWDDRDNLYFTDGRVIWRFSRLGELETLITLETDHPIGNFVVAKDGRIFVSDPYNHRIEVFHPDGRLKKLIGASQSYGSSQLSLDRLYLDSSGALYGLTPLRAFAATGRPPLIPETSGDVRHSFFSNWEGEVRRLDLLDECARVYDLSAGLSYVITDPSLVMRLRNVAPESLLITPEGNLLLLESADVGGGSRFTLTLVTPGGIELKKNVLGAKDAPGWWRKLRRGLDGGTYVIGGEDVIRLDASLSPVNQTVLPLRRMNVDLSPVLNYEIDTSGNIFFLEKAGDTRVSVSDPSGRLLGWMENYGLLDDQWAGVSWFALGEENEIAVADDRLGRNQLYRYELEGKSRRETGDWRLEEKEKDDDEFEY